MTKLEIHREDVHERKKWKNIAKKRKSNPIGKRTINRYYIFHLLQELQDIVRFCVGKLKPHKDDG